MGRRLARLGSRPGGRQRAVSLSWMVVVSLWPAASRPYVDGSSDNSIFSQVFVYNGFGRLDQASPNQLLTKAIGLALGSPPPGWDRLLSGAYGRDTGWLIPAALIALVAGLLVGAARADGLLRPDRVVGNVAGRARWSFQRQLDDQRLLHRRAVAGRSRRSSARAWRLRGSIARARRRAGAVAAAVAASCGYAAWLLPRRASGLVAGLARSRGRARPRRRRGPAHARPRVDAASRRDRPRRGRGAGGPRGGLGLGRRQALRAVRHPVRGGRSVGRSPGRSAGVAKQTEALLPPLESAAHNQPDLMATQTSAVAAPFIYDSGRGGPTDRRLHRHDPGAVTRRALVDDRRREISTS